jgi:Na+-driven multidrug efflux pump
MRKVNKGVFLVMFFTVLVLAYYSFFGALRGMSSQNPFTHIADVGITVFSFPCVTILSFLHIEIGLLGAIVLLLVDCLLYAFLLERVIAWYANRGK